MIKLSERVLTALHAAAGASVSGGALAKEFGVSRTAVWKIILRLRDEGHVIESAPRKGYRLIAGALSAPAVMSPLRGPARQCQVYYYNTLESTNLILKQLAEEGAPEGTVMVANAQTQGRGQRGREFFSPPGTGLYLSVLLRRSLHLGAARCLTAAAAVAAAEAVREVCALSVGIKWVNDIYLHGRKAGGILTEGALEYESGYTAYAVLGLGLNLLAPAQGFPPELSDTVTSLYAPGAEPETDVRGRLAAEFLSRLFMYCDSLEEKEFLPAYRRLSCLPGRRLACYGGGRVFSAVAVGIDDEARLIVRLSDGREEVLTAGEVSVLPETRRGQSRFSVP
ncbi:MAG: biotin--[acetyl-CoA-carboxylase] ligase [Gracilibacteraceae bacterium]|jgi:BirA family biotin operon repressor/biotin-[acetyl-CoA-carboxylase] ligase|nr:biotin--[acetyl-CoA-carboxylase] ligase [Gracilibacteraceae bacterium]